MNARKIYYRRKDKAIIIEGKIDDKSVLIWTLPNPEKLLELILPNSSIFTKEKTEKIQEKLKRLDKKEKREQKLSPEVPTMFIKRTEEKDESIKKTPTEEETKMLWEMSK